MKTIVAGGRSFHDYATVKRVLDEHRSEITEVVSGGANGADRLGERWAYENKVKLKVFPADWRRHGKVAGMIRNREMVQYAEALIAFPGGSGTDNCIMLAMAKFPHYVTVIK